MIEVKEKRRRFKRKFHEEDECTAQPKETIILDMSVSKLAKAKTRVNLEPSLRKTVMIVNTIRKIEQEIENGKDVTVDKMCVAHCVTNGSCSDTRPARCWTPSSDQSTYCTGDKSLTLISSLERRNEPFVCENNSETSDNRCRSLGVTLTKSDVSDETFIDLAGTADVNLKNKFISKRSSSFSTNGPSHNDLPILEEEEINFAEIDISLYDFDASLSWSESGLQIACGELEETNDNIYKTNTGLSTLFRRCSDDYKLSKTTENSFTDDLDQIMQVLVGI